MSGYVFRGGAAVVTGAASGIGEGLAFGLAERGSGLALVDRDGDGLRRVAKEIGERHPEIIVREYVADLAETERLAALADNVMTDFPAVTLLINNAGVALGGRFDQIMLDDFAWLMRINLIAPVHLTYAFLPRLREQPGSHLVNVSSLYGLMAPPGQSAYSASKFGLRGFTEALRHELRDAGVGVTTVFPGGIRTKIADNARLGPGVDPRDAARFKAQFGRLLTIDPRDAAEEILDGVATRKPRVLIGASAKIPDILARLTPTHYWSVILGLARLRGFDRQLLRGTRTAANAPRAQRDESQP